MFNLRRYLTGPPWRSLALLALAVAPAPATAVHGQVPPVGSGYWHTDGTTILDADNRPVRIAAVNWYGMETANWVPAGLDYQPYTTIMRIIKLLGYNTIRLPFSNELVERDPVVHSAIAANAEFRGLHALQVMDAIVAYAGRIGLKIILDDQRSRAPRPTQINTPNEPFWYSARYPESAWINDWVVLARRYLDNDAVIGADLRNEPHVPGQGPFAVSAYVQRGPTWGPYNGVENPKTDWRLAAQRAGDAILSADPHLLIIVEGLQLYPDPSQPRGVSSSWWAGILTPAQTFPVTLDVPHELVYSVHDYGPVKHAMPWFTPLSYHSLVAAWHRNWAFLLDNPDATNAAPVFVGEFGTCNTDPTCVQRRKPDNQAAWFQGVVRFLRRHPTVGWGLFALNGTNANNCQTTNGLLSPAWNNVSDIALQRSLRSIEPQPGVLPSRTGVPLIPGATTSRLPRDPHSALCLLP
ncbi:MAG TPA: glycoside hydrolase family 5 protein [Chloroflexota bacterium]|nr:glycoside hydrolase family 5 protein [Chloroflexota bacterium]